MSEYIKAEAEGYDFVIDLPSFYVYVNSLGKIYDIVSKVDRTSLSADEKLFNEKYGQQFLKELDDLYQLYVQNKDRLWMALMMSDVARMRLILIGQGKLKPPL
ncbi:MAG: hypothetical protein ACP5GH_07400 [Nitrososphaeria archaeon]